MVKIGENTSTATALREINISHSRWVETSSEWAVKLDAFQDNAAEYITDRVVLTAVPKGATKIAIMLSGGEDSSFLLDVVKRHRPDAELHAFSAATKGNVADIARAQTLCDRLEVPLKVLKPKKGELDDFEAGFCKLVGRPSKDPAQPIHNYVSNCIASEIRDAPILDGQFCDTVLHSNPHNTLLMAYKRMGPTKLVAPVFRRLFARKGAGRGTRRLLTALELVGSKSVEEFILRSCQISVTDENLVVAKQLTSTFNAQTALTSLFFWVTTNDREREKYLLPEQDYIIPFDSEELFWLASYSFEFLVNIRVRKIPIHTYLATRYPDLFYRQRTLPFEPI